MLDYNYPEELEKRTVTPDYIIKNIGGGLYSNFFGDSGIALVRVICYAVANEEELFLKILDGISNTKAPYYKTRLNYEELFNCLSLLGDDCLRILLSKLNCSDDIICDLHQSIVNKDLRLFQDTIIRGSINSSPITPICRLLYINIFFVGFIEKVYKIDQELKQITDKELHDKKERQAEEYVIWILLSFMRQVLTSGSSEDNQMIALLPDAMEFANIIDSTTKTDDFYYNILFQELSKSLNIPKDISKEDFFVVLYKLVLIVHYVIPKELNMSSMAQNAIHKILFKPEYEYIWGKYDNIENAADTILDEMKPYIYDDENAAYIMQQNEDVKLIEATSITKEIDNANVEANDNELSSDDYEKAMEAITEIINKFDDEMFEEPYNKQKVVRFFEELLTSDVGIDYNIDQKNLKESLSSSISNKNNREKSDYTYKGLNIMVFSRVIGYLIKNNVFVEKPMDISKALINMGVKNKNYADEDGAKQPAESISKYIIHAKNEKLSSRRSKMVEFILNNMKTE